VTVYVVGFAFHKGKVALIYKRRGPRPVVNKYNGIGGHVEKGEPAMRAMEREFEEETSVKLRGWERFCVLRVKAYGAIIYFYRVRIVGECPELQQTTDEQVSWHYIDDIRHLAVVPNLHWLIPLAYDPGKLSTFVDDNTPE